MPTRRALLAVAAASLASACTGRGQSEPTTPSTTAPIRSSSPAPSSAPSSSAATAPPPPASSLGSPSASSAPATAETSTTTSAPSGSARAGKPQVITTGLQIPWGLAFLPDGSALVTERASARLLQISPTGAVTELGTVPGVASNGEGGLLGITVASTYANDHLVWAYHSTDEDNRIVRFTVRANGLSAPVTVLRGIATAVNHNGGRLAFGPDGFLYATTGDALDSDRAQDLKSLNGKVLRIAGDGRPAPKNPDPTSPVYSYGHRNSEGLAWGPGNRLYEAELGESRFDEINLLSPGDNYGWPIVEGRDPQNRYVQPLVTWPTSECSPSGIAYTPSATGGALWVGALRGERLWRIPVTPSGTLGEPEGLFVNQFGRIRTVAAAPDGSLWLTTSNRDGRGSPIAEDDRIIRVPLA
jgi:glucose/arabinose dehydrogenase